MMTSTVVMANDTIRISKTVSLLASFPIGPHMFQGQTPQTFRINQFDSLFASLSQDEREILMPVRLCAQRCALAPSKREYQSEDYDGDRFEDCRSYVGRSWLIASISYFAHTFSAKYEDVGGIQLNQS